MITWVKELAWVEISNLQHYGIDIGSMLLMNMGGGLSSLVGWASTLVAAKGENRTLIKW